MTLSDDWEEAIERAFSGQEKPEDLGQVYKSFGEGIIKQLLKEEHKVSAYLALSAFIDELLGDLMESLLYTEAPSTSERDRLRRVDSRSKADLLRVTGVIDSETRNQISEFWSHRNDFAHEASKHVYSEEQEMTLKNGFKQGLRAYNELLELYPDSFSPDW